MARLLVVDDDPDTLELLEVLLSTRGYEVVGARHAAVATRALERGAFDLVLADLMVDTFDVATSWTQVDRLVSLARPARVGLITAWPVDAERAHAHRVAFTLAKPCRSHELIGQVASALRCSPLSAARRATIERYLRAFGAADAAVIDALCTDDVVYHLPGDRRGADAGRGRDGLAAVRRALRRDDREPRLELRAVRALPGGAMAEYDAAWSTAAAELRVPGAILFGFRGHRIAQISVRVELDALA